MKKDGKGGFCFHFDFFSGQFVQLAGFVGMVIEGSLQMEKQRLEESEKRREEKKRDDQRRERVRRKKMQVREKVEKSRFTVFFPMICGSGGSKSRLATAAGAEPSGQMRDEKLHAVLARSTLRSQNAQNTPFSEHLFHS